MRFPVIVFSHTTFEGHAAALALLLLGCQSPPTCPVGEPDAGAEWTARRSTVDRFDEDELPKIHLVYLVAADVPDRLRDVDGSIESSIRRLNDFLEDETGDRLRVDAFEGHPDITFLRMARTEHEIGAASDDLRVHVQDALVVAGLNRRDRIYLVYYEGQSDHWRGVAARPPFVPPVPAPPILTASVLTESCRPGGEDIGLWEYVALHEVLHTLGAVPDCPSNPTSEHVLDPNDIMYPIVREGVALHVDVNRDEYWGHGRVGCPDLARSVFLDPMPAEPVTPPGWSF